LVALVAPRPGAAAGTKPYRAPGFRRWCRWTTGARPLLRRSGARTSACWLVAWGYRRSRSDCGCEVLKDDSKQSIDLISRCFTAEGRLERPDDTSRGRVAVRLSLVRRSIAAQAELSIGTLPGESGFRNVSRFGSTVSTLLVGGSRVKKRRTGEQLRNATGSPRPP
jgi:hypothetical protein